MKKHSIFTILAVVCFIAWICIAVYSAYRDDSGTLYVIANSFLLVGVLLAVKSARQTKTK